MKDYDQDCILNFDETPCYITDQHKKTIDQRGAKSIEVIGTGSESRFTVGITITAAGTMLPGYIIWKGLKNVPACFKQVPAPENIRMSYSESGSMDRLIMIDYINQVVRPHIKQRKCLLIMDEFGSHHTEDVLNYLDEIGIQAKIIPGGFTSYLQILDVCINAPYKSNNKNLCNDWFGDENHQQYTTTCNRRKPGYNLIAQWVSESLN